jgi:hypothetical protein
MQLTVLCESHSRQPAQPYGTNGIDMGKLG